MPRLIKNPINSDFSYGQHYVARGLNYGKRIYSGGMCIGLTVAWIKKVHTRGELNVLPHPMEGMISQAIYGDGYSWRDKAVSNIDEEAEVTAFALQSLDVDPSVYLNDPDDIRICSIHGISYRSLGIASPFRITHIIHAAGTSERVQTYLLGAAGHATAIATLGDEVAFFDSNEGITIFTRREAVDNVMLMGVLDRLLGASKFRTFAIAELAF